MDSNEEYLDNLLKSLVDDNSDNTKTDGPEELQNEEEIPVEFEEGNGDLNDGDLEALLAGLEGLEEDGASLGAEPAEYEEPVISDAGMEESLDGLTFDEPAEVPEKDPEEPAAPSEPENRPEESAPEDEPAEPADDVKMMNPEEIEAMFAAMDAEEGQEAGEKDSIEDMILSDEMSAEEAAAYQQDNEEEAESDASDERMDDDEMLALLEGMAGEEGSDGAEEAEYIEEPGEALQPEPVREKKSRRKKKEKPEAAQTGEKKPGLLARIFQALTESDEDEAPGADGDKEMDMEEANRALLEEEGREAGASAKGKKEKKKKEKKVKKGKKAKEEAEEGEEGEDKGKKKKAKKERKPKKEKKPREPKAPEPKGKPLPKKKVAAIIAFAATLFAAVLLFTRFIPGVLEIRQAKEAFQAADYEEAFTLLYGKNLEEEEERMYNGALLVMQMQRQLDSYANYIKMDNRLQALSALVKGVGKYQTVLKTAEEYGVADQTTDIYARLLSVLQENFGVTEEKALEILSAKDDVYYTMELKAVLGEEIPSYGQQQISGGTPAAAESGERQTAEADDVLPEEEGMIGEYE